MTALCSVLTSPPWGGGRAPARTGGRSDGSRTRPSRLSRRKLPLRVEIDALINMQDLGRTLAAVKGFAGLTALDPVLASGVDGAAAPGGEMTGPELGGVGLGLVWGSWLVIVAWPTRVDLRTTAILTLFTVLLAVGIAALQGLFAVAAFGAATLGAGVVGIGIRLDLRERVGMDT